MNIGQGAHGVVCNWANLLPFELCLSDDFRGSCPGQYSLPSQTDFFFQKTKKSLPDDFDCGQRISGVKVRTIEVEGGSV